MGIETERAVMTIEKDDWTALTISLVLHILLLSGFSLYGAFDTAPQPMGFVEVELGPLAEGQPVEQALEQTTAPDRPALEPEPEPEADLQEEEITSSPIDLPEQPEEIVDEEEVRPPEDEETDAEAPGPASDEETDEADAPAVSETGSGTPDGSAGRTEGDEGEGTSQEKSAPFQIEGLNRVALTSPLPQYTEKVNATIKMRITVDPEGRVVERIPLLKGNPTLEKAVMDALQRWRFNPLPDNAPQENQTGVITFRFRLE